MKPLLVVSMVLLSACADRPVREGTLPGGETFREYSRIPYGYERVIYAADGHELGRQQLHTEENFKRIKPGMTKAELADVIGAGFATTGQYANGTTSETTRFYDGVHKLLHVIFGPDGRVLRYEVEWDPNVYSKKK